MSSTVVTKSCFNYSCLKKGVDLKVCGKCKSAWYCSSECQKSDWKKHKTDCKFLSSMKEDQDTALGDMCARCQTSSRPLKKCSKCLVVCYCSKECQIAHWRDHKPVCNTITESNLPEILKRDKKNSNSDGGPNVAKFCTQSVWQEIQTKGQKLLEAYKHKEGVSDTDDEGEVVTTLSQAVSMASGIFNEKKIVTNFEMVPTELYGFRICQGQQILVAQITGFHPEIIRHGIFVTDEGGMTSFVLFHVDNIPDPRPHFKWSDIAPRNYIIIKDPSFQKFPGKFLGFVIDDASDVRVLRGLPLTTNDYEGYMVNMKTYTTES
ncbi:hypothetical protein KUTeg_011575 [Tegillarca granosa]|uniref:MYND-type domain-containing protein n=1 Tax=Tegillarca granosa TaxID=220873 RepID=A0ABQ9EX05_TEGGR|nr:hypothetical protein KUTeg_011575 [Tegillarca granosa]